MENIQDRSLLYEQTARARPHHVLNALTVVPFATEN